MDGLHPRPRTDRRGARRHRHRTRPLARRADRISPDLRSGRTALPHPPRPFPQARPAHLHVPQQDEGAGAADPHLGRLHAAQWRGRRGRPLERGNLALPAERLRPEDPPDPAVWRELPASGHDDPGLGRDLRRPRAALRHVRISVRNLGAGGQSERADRGRRQSVRGTPLASLSQSAADAELQPRSVRQGGARARLQAVPAAVRQHVAGLHQSARRAAWTVHLLRILRMVWLRQLFQGESRRRRSCRSSCASPTSATARTRR